MSPFWDLRRCVHDPCARERLRDCADFLANPAVVAVIATITVLVLCWGLWAAASYMAGRDRNLRFVWWQSTCAFVLITIFAFALPYRLRFGFNVYGVLFLLLLVEYAIFAVAFPVGWITAEHVDAVLAYAKSQGFPLPPETTRRESHFFNL